MNHTGHKLPTGYPGDTGPADTPDPTEDEEEPKGCGCASGASPSWLLWVVLPVLWLRRRR